MRHQTAAAAAAAAAVRLLLAMLAATAAAAADARPQPLHQAQPQNLPPSSPSTIRSEAASPSPTSQAAARIKELSSGKLDSNSVPQPLPARAQALTCPTDVEQLNPGVDLAQAASTPNKTYVLQPGTYWINSTISLITAGIVTCYTGDDTAARDAVKIFAGPGIVVPTPYAFFVNNGAGLGLQNLLLDGQGSAGGVSLLSTSTLEVTKVTMQRCISGNSGSAVNLGAFSTGRITEAVFRDNTAPTGGAMYVGNSATLNQVTFERNTARDGGAIFFASGAIATFEGDNRISGNSASDEGGAIYIDGTVVINGRFCATSNTAGGNEGGFAYIVGSLLFSEGSDVHLGDHAPDTVWLLNPSTIMASVKCGANSPSWAADATTSVRFYVTGPACACNQSFTSSTAATQSCDGCNGISWNPARCACGDCDTPGEGCCGSDGTIRPQGTVCRHSAGPCDIEEKCTSDGTCPEDSFVVAGALCRSPRAACERPSVCSGENPLCPKTYAVNGKPCPFTTSDVKNVFWPIWLQSDADEQAYVPRTMRYRHDPELDTDDDLPREDPEDTSTNEYYRRQNWNDDSDKKAYESRDSNWPECFGSCFAGKCTLEQARPGCCHLDYHGLYASSQQMAAVASDVYKQHGSGRDLVCWRGESDTPQIVQGQA